MSQTEPLQFQHYQVLQNADGSPQELGRGAMGITYKAFDTNLRCEACLKVITPSLLDHDESKERFLREARVAATIRHPNVASVFHLGDVDGKYFYVMEFIQGEDLKAFIAREGALALPIALDITLQVARALVQAEKKNLIHRDIKPANIMLIREDHNEMLVKLIDFGLAKPTMSSGDSMYQSMTSVGFLGTPVFASPEQIMEHELDTRSDIYSLGLTLWYMLTGQAAFGGSLAQLLNDQLHTVPDFSRLPPMPENCLNLLKSMVEKDPARRPQNALQLRNMVAECLAEVAPSMAYTLGTNTSYDMEALHDPSEAATMARGGTAINRTQTMQNPVGNPARKGLLIATLLLAALVAGGIAFLLLRDQEEQPTTDDSNTSRIEPPPPTANPAEELAKIHNMTPVPARIKALAGFIEHFNDAPEAEQARSDLLDDIAELKQSPPPANDLFPIQPILEQLANQGSTDAMELLSIATARSNSAQAIDWLLRAAETLDPSQPTEAIRLYGRALDLAPGGRQPKAETALRRYMPRITQNETHLAPAADNFANIIGRHFSDQPALEFLAAFYRGKDEKEAFAWGKKLAEFHDARHDVPATLQSYAQLAQHFDQGEPFDHAVEKIDLQVDVLRHETLTPERFQALRPTLETCADLPSVSAMLLLAESLRETEPETAFTWFREAANTGSVEAMIQTGLMCSNGSGVDKDYRKAVSWFNGAAIQGSPKAKFLLAECYLLGKGTDRDEARAVGYLEDAVADGWIPAMDKLADCLRRGRGTAPDKQRAFELYQQAVNAGHIDSNANLAVLYMTGDGVDKNPAMAIKLLRAGVDQNNPACMYFYASALHDGLGIERDQQAAEQYFKQAAAAGFGPAIKFCREHNLPFDQ